MSSPPSSSSSASSGASLPVLPDDAASTAAPAPTPKPTRKPTRARTSRVTPAHPNAEATTALQHPASATHDTPATSLIVRDTRNEVALNGDVPELERALIILKTAIEQLERDGEAIEAYEKLREKTAVALRLEVVSCRLASEVWHRDRTFPDFTFPTEPCFRGKDRPDQDCRTCVNCVLVPWGHKHMGAHETRFPGHGVVFPLANEDDAVRVAAALRTLNIAHLRRPTHELHALRRAHATATVNLQRARDEAANPDTRG